MEAILSQLGSNSIDSPQGGATAASPFVCRNVGGSICNQGFSWSISKQGFMATPNIFAGATPKVNKNFINSVVSN